MLLLRGAAAESTIARLLCARNDVTWHEGPAGAADLFDGAEVGDVIATEDGLIAVGVPLMGSVSYRLPPCGTHLTGPAGGW